MRVEPLAALFSAIDIVVFERRGDGTFAAVAPVPDWFRHLGRDLTFPFLGHFLDEAREFWGRTKTGRLRSGLCEDVEPSGRQFHYEVSAVSLGDTKYLLFELVRDAEQMQSVMQKARQLALDHEALRRTHDALTAKIRTSLSDIDDLTRELNALQPDSHHADLLRRIRGTSKALLEDL